METYGRVPSWLTSQSWGNVIHSCEEGGLIWKGVPYLEDTVSRCGPESLGTRNQVQREYKQEGGVMKGMREGRGVERAKQVKLVDICVLIDPRFALLLIFNWENSALAY